MATPLSLRAVHRKRPEQWLFVETASIISEKKRGFRNSKQTPFLGRFPLISFISKTSGVTENKIIKKIGEILSDKITRRMIFGKTDFIRLSQDCLYQPGTNSDDFHITLFAENLHLNPIIKFPLPKPHNNVEITCNPKIQLSKRL